MDHVTHGELIDARNEAIRLVRRDDVTPAQLDAAILRLSRAIEAVREKQGGA